VEVQGQVGLHLVPRASRGGSFCSPKGAPSYGGPGPRGPDPHYRTTRESFPLTWLFRVRALSPGPKHRAFVIGSFAVIAHDNGLMLPNRGLCGLRVRRRKHERALSATGEALDLRRLDLLEAGLVAGDPRGRQW
jgi:hypothetical protein